MRGKVGEVRGKAAIRLYTALTPQRSYHILILGGNKLFPFLAQGDFHAHASNPILQSLWLPEIIT